MSPCLSFIFVEMLLEIATISFAWQHTHTQQFNGLFSGTTWVGR